MPAQRAILADIHEFGLDHSVAHSTVKASGRLASKTETATQSDEQVVHVEAATVEPPTPVVEQVSSEPAPVEVETTTLNVQPVEEAQVESSTDVDSDAASKKTKRSKKDKVDDSQSS